MSLGFSQSNQPVMKFSVSSLLLCPLVRRGQLRSNPSVVDYEILPERQLQMSKSGALLPGARGRLCQGNSQGPLWGLPQWEWHLSVFSLLAGIPLTAELGVPHKGPRKRAALCPPWGLFGIYGLREVISETQLWVLLLSQSVKNNSL